MIIEVNFYRPIGGVINGHRLTFVLGGDYLENGLRVAEGKMKFKQI